MRNAEPHDVFRSAARDGFSLKYDVSMCAAHAGERAQRRGLARPIGAEQGRDAAFVDRQLETEQDLRGAVEGAEPARFEEPAHFVVPR